MYNCVKCHKDLIMPTLADMVVDSKDAVWCMFCAKAALAVAIPADELETAAGDLVDVLMGCDPGDEIDSVMHLVGAVNNALGKIAVIEAVDYAEPVEPDDAEAEDPEYDDGFSICDACDGDGCGECNDGQIRDE